MKCESAVRNLSARIRERYGAAVDRILVFGSVARGTAGEGSDVDVMVIMDDAMVRPDWHVEREIRSLALTVELEEDVVFDLKVASKSGLSSIRGHTPFMERALAESVAV